MAKDDPLADVGKPRQGKRPLSILDRSIQAAVADERSLGAKDDPAREEYPLLWEWLTRTTAPGNFVITPGKLMVTGAEGGFVLTLTHADMAQSIELSVTRLTDLFRLLEEHMGGGHCIPKPWGKKQPTARKKKPIQ